MSNRRTGPRSPSGSPAKGLRSSSCMARCDHIRYDPLVAELGDGVTTFAMDRRGYGASGDAPRYAIWREFEDVAAVVDAVADRTGEPVALWGHSYGANCAMGGTARTDNVHHLLLYEPGL